MKVRIKRQDDRRSAPYWQVFHFRGEGRITVAAILEKLNERDQLEDIKGKQCRNPLGMWLYAENVRRLCNGDQRASGIGMWSVH